MHGVKGARIRSDRYGSDQTPAPERPILFERRIPQVFRPIGAYHSLRTAPLKSGAKGDDYSIQKRRFVNARRGRDMNRGELIQYILLEQIVNSSQELGINRAFIREVSARRDLAVPFDGHAYHAALRNVYDNAL